MIHAMTGPWLIVKWAGITILSCYLALIVVVFWRFWGKVSQLRPGLAWPIVLGNFVGQSLPWIFDNVVFARVCFVAASAIYSYGIAVLLRGLTQEGCKSLFKEGKAENYIQPLKLS